MMLIKKQLFWGYNATLQHELKKQQCITQKGKPIYTKILYLNVKKKSSYKEVSNLVYNEHLIRHLFFLDMIHYDNDPKIGKT